MHAEAWFSQDKRGSPTINIVKNNLIAYLNLNFKLCTQTIERIVMGNYDKFAYFTN